MSRETPIEIDPQADNSASNVEIKTESSPSSSNNKELPNHSVSPQQLKQSVRSKSGASQDESALNSTIGEHNTDSDATTQVSVNATPKRKRGRPRKDQSQKTEEVKESPKLELTPRRSGRRAVLDKLKQEKEATQVNEIDDVMVGGYEAAFASSDDSGSEFSEDEEPKRRKRQLKSPTKSRTPRKSTPRKPKYAELSSSDEELPLSGSPSKESTKRTKVGRPSKQEQVTQNIVSIFHMDDNDIFFDRNESREKEKPQGREKGDTITLNFENNGQSSFSGVPTISGIKKREVPKSKDGPITKFTPLPIPEVDADGNIADPLFIEKHLADVKLQLDNGARLTDERAFFLEGSEGYFEQHSLRFRPSASSLTTHAPSLDYEELIPLVKLGQLVHKREKDTLRELYKGLYHQWCFELSQGYSLNFFGVGSKANLMMEFANDYLFDWYDEVINDSDEMPGVMVINGYNPNTKLKSVLHDIVSTVVTQEDMNGGNIRMPKHVTEVFPFLLSHLKKSMVPSTKNGIVKVKLILLIHNIDGEAFRDERSQNLLSQLAALPNVWLITSTDNINSSLLWDLYRFKNFNFLWHDVTTYESYEVEMSYKDILSMGRSKKFVGSKGVKYVLTSLTENARKLYKILLQMQLAKLEESSSTKSGRTGLRPNLKLGLQLRHVYDKCVEEYVANNEINFKTMLGEYVEHKMCTLAKNTGGVEIVFVPFTYDEMEKLLEEEF